MVELAPLKLRPYGAIQICLLLFIIITNEWTDVTVWSGSRLLLGFRVRVTIMILQKVKVAHTRLPSVGFRSWSRFLAVSLQVMWVINPAVGCHYFPPGLQLPPQPSRGLLPIWLLNEQRHNGCEQFAEVCYPTASRLRFEPRPYCVWVQHAIHSATEPPSIMISRV